MFTNNDDPNKSAIFFGLPPSTPLSIPFKLSLPRLKLHHDYFVSFVLPGTFQRVPLEKRFAYAHNYPFLRINLTRVLFIYCRALSRVNRYDDRSNVHVRTNLAPPPSPPPRLHPHPYPYPHPSHFTPISYLSLIVDTHFRNNLINRASLTFLIFFHEACVFFHFPSSFFLQKLRRCRGPLIHVVV